MRPPIFASTLSQILCLSPPTGVLASQNRLYSFRVDFDELWKSVDIRGSALRNWLKEGAGPERTIIVVHDGEPPGEHGLWRHLSPYDWAVALSLSLVDGRPLPTIRIVIVDLLPSVTRGCFGFEMSDLLRAALPWIRSFTLLGRDVSGGVNNDEIGDVAPIGSEDCSTFLSVIGINGRVSPGFPSLADAAPSPEVAARIKGVWISELAGVRKRHHLSNKLAPVLLSSGFPEPLRSEVNFTGTNQGGDALMRFLVVLGLATPSSASESILRSGMVPAESFALEINPFGRPRGLQVLLLDDQYQLGYQHILGALFYGSAYVKPTPDSSRYRYAGPGNRGPVTIEATTDWSSFLGAMAQKGKVGDWDSPRLFRLRDNFGPDMVLLDLRLWELDSSEPRGAVDFFGSLLNLAERLGAQKIQDHALGEALAAGRIALERPREPVLPAGLTLLPLLLSHFDPSLPIVIHSSTHQREVADLLSHRPNVLRGFMKPALSGYQQEAPSHSLLSLRRTIQSAIQLQVARVAWEELACLPDHEIQWSALLCRTSEPHEAVPRLTINAEFRKRCGLELQRTLLAGRFADSLLGPYNLLEVTGQMPLDLDDLTYKRRGTAGHERRIDFGQYRAQIWWWKIIALFRHARAHYRLTHHDDEQLRLLSTWLWLWFLAGLREPLTFGSCRDWPNAGASSQTQSIWEVLVERLSHLINSTTRGLAVSDRRLIPALNAVLSELQSKATQFGNGSALGRESRNTLTALKSKLEAEGR
jgi:hypothetical protein